MLSMFVYKDLVKLSARLLFCDCDWILSSSAVLESVLLDNFNK